LIIRDFSRGFFARLNVPRVSVLRTESSKFAAFAQVSELLEREKSRRRSAWGDRWNHCCQQGSWSDRD
jgi:hypothetical protein